MAIGYRSIMRLDEDTDALHVAETELSAWLRSKRHDGIEVSEWEDAGEHQLSNAAKLTVVHGEDGMDGSRRRLYRLVEDKGSARWTTSVYALDTPRASPFQRQTIVVEVAADAPDSRSAIRLTGTPRLVKNILRAHDAHDGSAPLTGAPQLIRGEEVEEVLAAILDPIRTASVIIAPVPDAEHQEKWTKVVTSLTVESIGVASSFVTDLEATRVLNQRLPSTHSVSAGVVRTYSPGVDPDVPEDRRRHLMLFPDTLARSLSGVRVARPLAIRHAESTRLRFIERELPGDVRRGIDLLRRAESAQHRAVTVEQTLTNATEEIRKSRVGDPTDSLQRDRNTVLQLQELSDTSTKRTDPAPAVSEDDALIQLGAQLEAKSAEVSLLEEQFEDAIAENDKLKQKMEEIQSQFEELLLSATIAEDEARNSDRTAAYFREKLSIPVDRVVQATSVPGCSAPSVGGCVGVISVGRSSSFPLWKTAPARTKATRCGALTARQRAAAASMSL